jgi:hypothetical protein
VKDRLGSGTAIFRRHPIPRVLFGPFLEAGLKHGNASTIAMFVVPCLESFDREKVDEWLKKRAEELYEDAEDRIEMARYHYVPTASLAAN